MLTARARLELAGLTPEEAALDARLLAQHALGWDATRFFTSEVDPSPAGFAEAYGPLIARREQREPLAYITGVREFWGLAFEVSPAVLVPRPETELLVEAALGRWPSPSCLRVADVCTGSGCIAIALAHERPAASIVATDISADALEVARRNAARHQVAARVECLRSDLLEGVSGAFDLIVSNPPYVPDRDRDELQREVRDYEPAVALFAGSQGLEIISRLAAQAAARLKPGGFLLFEFGAGQDQHVQAVIAATAQLQLLDLKRDLQGIPRTAIVQRNSGRSGG